MRGDQRDRGRHERHVEHRLLDQAVEEDRRRPDRQQRAGDDAGARGEQASRRPRRPAPRRATRSSAWTTRTASRSWPASGVDDAQEVGIERRLVEDVGADPVAAGQPPRPLRRSRARRPSAPRSTASPTSATGAGDAAARATAKIAQGPAPGQPGRRGQRRRGGRGGSRGLARGASSGRAWGHGAGRRRPRKLSIAQRPARPRRGDRRLRPPRPGVAASGGPASCAAGRTHRPSSGPSWGGRGMGTGEGFPCQDCMKQMPARV